MGSKTIYLIRHGETDYNRRGVVQGSGIDSDLNELGLAQARAFFEVYQHVPFDKVYTSELKRTHQTVADFINIGIPHEIHSGLNEISWGIKEGKIPNSQEDELYKNIIASWQKGETHVPCEGGESPEDVAKRQKPFLDLILSRSEEELILVAMHGRAMRILLTQILNRPLHEMDEFEHSNVCLYKLNFSYKTNSFMIEAANDITHLLMLEV